jgi:DNA adenine methylase
LGYSDSIVFKVVAAINKNMIAFMHYYKSSMKSNVLQSPDNQGLLCNDLPLSYPFLKWAGGKTQILFELEKFIPSEFNRYFEPFLGGGAMFFHLTTRNLQFKAYLSDINEELITSYKVVEDNVEKLIGILTKHQEDYNKSPIEFYYELRKFVPHTNVERAARFITLNKTCYNGLYRVNKRGVFNVPIGRYNNPLICDSNNLRHVSLSIRYSKAMIELSDYKQILLENAREGDFVYLDPPYNPVSSTASFTSYTNSGFTSTDQRELKDVFTELNDRKCKVLLSNSDTKLIRELYSEFAPFIKEVDVIRCINSRVSKRIGHKELIISNYS